MTQAHISKKHTGWQIIFEYLLTYRKEVIILSLLGIISGLANGAVPFIVGRLFDGILSTQNFFVGSNIEMPVWAFFLIVLGTTQVVVSVVDWVNDKERRRIGTLIYAEYPQKAVVRLLSLPISFHAHHKTGEVWDRITRAGNSLGQIIEQVITNIAPQILSVFVGLAIAFTIKPTLAATLIAGLALYLGTLIRIVPPIVKLQRKGNKAWNRAYGNAVDAVYNVRTIKQSTAEGYEAKKSYRDFILRANRLWFRVEEIWSGISFYQRIIIALTQIVVFFFSIYYIQNGGMTIGDLIALNGYAAMIFGPFVILATNWQVIQSGVVAIERAQSILDTEPEAHTNGKLKVLNDIDGDVVFKNVSFAYPGTKKNALTDINIEVKHGEVVALVGESGGGKSTLIELISGYYFPRRGSVTIDGHSTRSINLMSLRKHIAVVPQEVALFNNTVLMNVRYGNFEATDEEVVAAAQKAHAAGFIERFPNKYKQIVGERGVKLSVGQKQRVAIARAILRDPKILILDEPTSALDSNTEKLITESLDKLMEGRTTFIIAHRLSTVRQADKIFVLDKGRIVESGSHDDLMKIEGGKYRYMYEYHVGLR